MVDLIHKHGVSSCIACFYYIVRFHIVRRFYMCWESSVAGSEVIFVLSLDCVF